MKDKIHYILLQTPKTRTLYKILRMTAKKKFTLKIIIFKIQVRSKYYGWKFKKMWCRRRMLNNKKSNMFSQKSDGKNSSHFNHWARLRKIRWLIRGISDRKSKLRIFFHLITLWLLLRSKTRKRKIIIIIKIIINKTRF